MFSSTIARVVFAVTILMATFITVVPTASHADEITPPNVETIQSWGQGFTASQLNPESNDFVLTPTEPERYVEIPDLAMPLQWIAQDKPGQAPTYSAAPGRIEKFVWAIIRFNPAGSDGAFLNPVQAKGWIKGDGLSTRLPGAPENQVYITWKGNGTLSVWIPNLEDEFHTRLTYYVWNGKQMTYGDQSGTINDVQAMVLIAVKI